MRKYEELLQALSLEQKIKLMTDMEYWNSQEAIDLGLPVFGMVRAESVYEDGNASLFSIAQTWNPELAYTQGKNIGAIALSTNNNLVYITANPKNIDNGFISEDPVIANDFLASLVQGINDSGAISVVGNLLYENCITKHVDAKIAIQSFANKTLDLPTLSFGDEEKSIKDALSNGLISEDDIDDNLDLVFDSVLTVNEPNEIVEDVGFYLSALTMLKNEEAMPVYSTNTIILGRCGELELDQITDVFRIAGIEALASSYAYSDSDDENKALAKEVTGMLKGADTAIVFLSAKANEYEIPKNQLDILSKVSKKISKTIAVVSASTVVDLTFADNVSGLILATTINPSAITAVAQVVAGLTNPSGKLTVSIPSKKKKSKNGEMPGADLFYFDDKPEFMYPFGYGLSYVAFDYSDITCKKESVSFVITNTTEFQADEIVEVFVEKLDGVNISKNKKLIGYVKLNLNGNESQEIELPIDENSFSYIDQSAGEWKDEPGKYIISVGPSLLDIRLTGEVVIEGEILEEQTSDNYLDSINAASVEEPQSSAEDNYLDSINAASDEEVETTAEENYLDEVNSSVSEEPVAEASPVEESVVEEAPVVEEASLEEVPLEDTVEEPVAEEAPIAEETPAEEPVVEASPVAEEPASEENPVVEEASAEETPLEDTAEEPVVEASPETEEAPLEDFADEPVEEASLEEASEEAKEESIQEETTEEAIAPDDEAHEEETPVVEQAEEIAEEQVTENKKVKEPKPKKEKPQKVKKEKPQKVKKEKPIKYSNDPDDESVDLIIEEKYKSSYFSARVRFILMFILLLYMDAVFAFTFVYLNGIHAPYRYYAYLITVVVVFNFVTFTGIIRVLKHRKNRATAGAESIEAIAESLECPNYYEEEIVEEEETVEPDIVESDWFEEEPEPENDGLMGFEEKEEAIQVLEISEEEALGEYDTDSLTDMVIENDLDYEEEMTLEEMSEEIYKYVSDRGLNIDHALPRTVLSALASSRLVFVKSKTYENTLKFFELLTEYLGGEYYIDYEAECWCKTDDLVWRSHKDTFVKTNFIKSVLASQQLDKNINLAFIENVTPEKLKDYFGGFLPYIKNPAKPYVLHVKGTRGDEMVQIPNNLWYVMFVRDESLNKMPYDISLCSATIELIVNEGKVAESPITYEKVMPCHHFIRTMIAEDVQSFISEEDWKKFDSIERFVQTQYKYTIGNKLAASLEAFTTAYMLAGGEVNDAIDAAIAYKLLPTIFAANKEKAQAMENQLSEYLDQLFGAENLVLTQKKIKNIRFE